MPSRKVIFADQARGAILRTDPSVAYVIEQVPTVFNLIYCAECTSFKRCRVTNVCTNPRGLKAPEPDTFCPFSRLKEEFSAQC